MNAQGNCQCTGPGSGQIPPYACLKWPTVCKKNGFGTGRKAQYLGCFADKAYTGISRPLVGAGRIKSKDRVVILKACENAAKMRGHNIFSIQDNNACFTGTEASKSYARDGVSKNCGTNGTGGAWANSVYKI